MTPCQHVEIAIREFLADFERRYPGVFVERPTTAVTLTDGVVHIAIDAAMSERVLSGASDSGH